MVAGSVLIQQQVHGGSILMIQSFYHKAIPCRCNGSDSFVAPCFIGPA
jgi:hypothetical protein